MCNGTPIAPVRIACPNIETTCSLHLFIEQNQMGGLDHHVRIVWREFLELGSVHGCLFCGFCRTVDNEVAQSSFHSCSGRLTAQINPAREKPRIWREDCATSLSTVRQNPQKR